MTPLYSKLKEDILSIAVIILFSFIFYLPIFTSHRTISSFDLAYFKYNAFKTLRPEYLKRPSNPVLSDPVNIFQPWDIAMLEGKLSFPWLWNPYNGCGCPLLANAESAVFFPFKYIVLLTGINKGFGFLYFLKTLLAGLLMYGYLRTLRLGPYARIIGSFGFMTCGFMIVWLQGPHSSSALFLPLLFMGCEFAFSGSFKKSLVVIGSGTALSFFGGHPETTVHCMTGTCIYAFGLYVLRWKNIRHDTSPNQSGYRSLRPLIVIGLSLLLGTLIAAVQILPTAEYIRNSYTLLNRAAENNSVSSIFSLSKKHIVALYRHVLFYLVPDTWGNPSIHDHWWWGTHGYKYHDSAYIGVGLLFLSCVSWAFCRVNKRIALFLILQVISLGIIIQVPFFEATIGLLPPFNVALNMGFVLLFSFSGAAMAAIIFDHFWNGGKASGPAKIWYLILIMIFSALTLFDFFIRFAFNKDPWMFRYGLYNILHFFIFFIPWIFLIGIYKMSPRIKTIAGAVLVIIAGADLYLIHASYNPTIEADQIYVEPQTVKNIKQHIFDARVIPWFQFSPCLGTIYQINDPRVWDGIDIAWYARYLEYTGYIFPLHQIMPDFNHRFVSIAAVRYVWIPVGIPVKGVVHYRKIFTDETSVLYENPDALPRAYITTSWQRVFGNQEALRMINEENFPWQKRVVIEDSENARKIMAGSQEGMQFIPAKIVSEGTHQITIQLPPGSQGLLVLNDSFYPGWKAFVDGKEKPVYRVNGAFRGVFISSTDKFVTFKYRPASFIIGLFISLVSLGIATIILLTKKGYYPLKISNLLPPG